MGLVPMTMTGKKAKHVRGFTLIELMVVISIVAVMMVFALPAFNDFTQQRRMASNVNMFVSAVNLARSEATRRGAQVTVQALDASDVDDEWGPGFCVTLDDPGDCDDPLRVFQLDGNVLTLDATDDFDGIDGIPYTARGLQDDGFIGTFRLCGPNADSDPGRVIAMNAIGRTTVRDLVCFP